MAHGLESVEASSQKSFMPGLFSRRRVTDENNRICRKTENGCERWTLAREGWCGICLSQKTKNKTETEKQQKGRWTPGQQSRCEICWFTSHSLSQNIKQSPTKDTLVCIDLTQWAEVLAWYPHSEHNMHDFLTLLFQVPVYHVTETPLLYFPDPVHVVLNVCSLNCFCRVWL